jgi:sulfite reductase alpha subunit-like flavoprotein
MKLPRRCSTEYSVVHKYRTTLDRRCDDVSQRDRQLAILEMRRGTQTTITRMASGPDQTRSALILYGSETGNAQEVAEELGSLAERLRFATQVCELNQSSPVRIAEGARQICFGTDWCAFAE